MCAISATARSKAAWLAWDGLVVPLTLRTYCSAAAATSSSVAGGSKLLSGRMLRHMPRGYVGLATRARASPPSCAPCKRSATLATREPRRSCSSARPVSPAS